MDENTKIRLCFEIVDRLATNKVLGFPHLPYLDRYEGPVCDSGLKRWEEDRLKLEAERLAFTDCHTFDISELQGILQSYDGTKQLPSVAYFEERVLRYGDERGVKKARAYEPGKIMKLDPGVQLHQDQASRDFLTCLTNPLPFVALYFKKGDKKAKEVAHKLRETVNEVIQDKTYFIEKDKNTTERPEKIQAKSITDPIVAVRNSVIREWYGKAPQGHKAKITAEKLDKIPGIEHDPVLERWMELTYTGALNNPSTYSRVKTLFSTIHRREKG